MNILGIDIGGSGIKAAPVDLSKGTLLTKRIRIETPQPATPEAVTSVVAEVVDHFSWKDPVGVAFPSRIKAGVVMTATNISPQWIGTVPAQLFAEATGCPMTVLNDADAAGLAEMAFGAGMDRPEIAIMLTFGTGLGSAFFVHGALLPNTELGLLILDGTTAEALTSMRTKKAEDLTWKQWASEVQRVLTYLEDLFSPDLIILGGGVSRPHKVKAFMPYLSTRARLVPAVLENEAGIIGAAVAARPRELQFIARSTSQ